MPTTMVGSCCSCGTMVHEPKPVAEQAAKEFIEKKSFAKPRADQLISVCKACNQVRVFLIWWTTYESAI
jgi:hypothetical protein